MTRTDDRDIPFTPPMECLPVASLPDGSGWVYELKLDGFRGQGIRDKRGVHRETGKTSPRNFRKSALLSRKLCHWEPPLTGNWSHSMRAVTRVLMPFRMPVQRRTSCFLSSMFS